MLQLSDSVRAILNSIHVVPVNLGMVTSPSPFVAVSDYIIMSESHNVFCGIRSITIQTVQTLQLIEWRVIRLVAFRRTLSHTGVMFTRDL